MINKTKLVLGIAAATLTVAGATVSQTAVAGSRAQHHANEAALMSKVDVLEAQLRAMQDEMASIRASGGGADSAKVQELDAWMQEHKARPEKGTHENMVFFRGGYGRNDAYRNDLLTGGQFGGESPNVITNVLGGGKTNQGAYYMGAGFDFGLTDDVWGLFPNVEVDAELMFEYKNFGAKHFTNHPAIVSTANPAEANNGNPAVNPNPQNGPLCTLIQYASSDELGVGSNGAGTRNCNSVNVSQFTLTAAPKFKFMKGSRFRPWLIPFGLGMHVISPPSNGITYITPGVMFAGGAEYAVWKDIKLGADVRYHYTGSDLDGVNANGLTAGGYLGIGF